MKLRNLGCANIAAAISTLEGAKKKVCIESLVADPEFESGSAVLIRVSVAHPLFFYFANDVVQNMISICSTNLICMTSTSSAQCSKPGAETCRVKYCPRRFKQGLHESAPEPRKSLRC